MDQLVLEQAFQQARLKIGRANRHLEEAKAWYQKYLESDFCRVVEEIDPESGDQIFKVVASALPDDLVLSVGDAFHNLSASLDYVMSGIMRAASGSSGRVTFPTNVDRQALRRSFMDPRDPKKSTPPMRQILKRVPGFVMLIFAKIKPYQGGPYRLWEVRRSDNTDKHNLIIPTVSINYLYGVVLEDLHRGNRIVTDCGVDNGGILNLLNYSGNKTMKIRTPGKASINIMFSNYLEYFAGKPVFPTLLECCELTREAVDIISAEPLRSYTRKDRA